MKLPPECRDDCLSKEQLAEKWDCSINDIESLISDKNELRLAVKTLEIPISGLRRYGFPDLELWSGLSRIFEGMGAGNSGANFLSSHFPPHQHILISKSEIVQPSIKEDLPQFLYRTFSNDILLDRQPFTAQDLQGTNYYILTGWCDYDTESDSYFNPEYLYLADEYFKYITIEEINRFELKMGIQSKKDCESLVDPEMKPVFDLNAGLDQSLESPLEKPNGLPWIQKARELAESIKRDFPKYNQMKIADMVHKEMISRNITGRGGRVPSVPTIKRDALKGIV